MLRSALLIMKVFVSHSHAQARDADALALALRNSGQEAVLDKDLLEGGDEYVVKLQRALQSSDLFLFMLSPEAVAPNCFALTEMALARKRWPTPKGHVLAVMWRQTPTSDVPEYLKSVSFLLVTGNAVAETVVRVVAIDAQRRAARHWRLGLALCGVLLAAGLVGVWHKLKTPPAAPLCLLRAVVQPVPTEPTTLEAGPAGLLDTFIVSQTDGVAQLSVAGLTRDDTAWTIEIKGLDPAGNARFGWRGCPRQPQEITNDRGHGVRIEPRP